VYQFAGLFTDGLRHRRVSMAESAHRDTTQGIQVLPVFRIPQPDAFTVFKLDWQAFVGRHEVISHFFTSSKIEKAARYRLPAFTLVLIL